MDDDTDELITDLPTLERRWRWIAGPWGFEVPQIFAILIDADGQQLPTVVNVTMEEGPPAAEEVAENLHASIATVLADVAPDGSIAVMWARPGPPGLTADDRVHVRALHGARLAAPVRTWPVFVATANDVALVPPDELLAPVRSRGAGSG